MAKLCMAMVLMLWGYSLGFKLKCQPSIPRADFLHLQDVSKDMEPFLMLMKDGVLSKFDDWCKATFRRNVALGIFTGPGEPYSMFRQFGRRDIIHKYNEIRVHVSNASARAVLNALSEAAKLNWYNNPSEANRVILLYTNKQPFFFLCSLECLKMRVQSVIDSLLRKDIHVILVVPSPLVTRYKSIFAAMRENLVVARMFPTVAETENELYAAMNELFCAVKRKPKMCEEESVMQLLHIQDFSWSYTDDMEDLRRQLPGSLRNLSSKLPEMEVALATFVDKPIRPFGYRSDYCYREDLAFTKDLSKYEKRLHSVRIRGGGDFKQSQFDAIYRALESDDLGWIRDRKRDGKTVYRIIVMATDSEPHVRGDADKLRYYSPKGCQYSDYPSATEIAEMLKAKDVIPLFIVTSYVYKKWQPIMQELSDEGLLVKLTETLDISEAIQDGVKKICDSKFKKMARASKKF